MRLETLYISIPFTGQTLANQILNSLTFHIKEGSGAIGDGKYRVICEIFNGRLVRILFDRRSPWHRRREGLVNTQCFNLLLF